MAVRAGALVVVGGELDLVAGLAAAQAVGGSFATSGMRSSRASFQRRGPGFRRARRKAKMPAPTAITSARP